MNESIIVNILAFSSILLLAFGPIILILWIIKRCKKWKATHPGRKILSIPLLILNAIPIAVICIHGLMGQESSEKQYAKDEIWIKLFFIIIVVEIIVTFIQCKWSGIWISVLRIFTGILLGGLIAYGFVFVIIIIAVLVIGGGGDGNKSGEGESLEESITIYRDGRTIRLRSSGSANKNLYYDDETGEDYYVMEDGRVFDSDNDGVYYSRRD